MKKIIFLTSIIALFLCSCAKNTSTELTAEQKATIEKEVRDQYDTRISYINELNYEAISADFSKDGFISSISDGDIRSTTYEEFYNTGKSNWSLRERQYVEPLEVQVTALSPNLALLTWTRIWETWFKNGDYRKDKSVSTQLYKKELEGWKIIHMHQSGTVIEEKLAD